MFRYYTPQFSKIAAKLALIGCAIGLIVTFATSKLLHSLLFGVSPFDPLTLTLAALFVMLLALAAAWLPAQRATSVELMQALRVE